MGNNSQKITTLQYKVKGTSTIVTIDLSKKKKFPPKPSEKEILNQLGDIVDDLDLPPEQRLIVVSQKPKTQWKIICHHRLIMQEMANIKANAQKKEVVKPISTKIETYQSTIYISKLKNTPTYILIKEVAEWFLTNPGENEAKNFIKEEGIEILCDILELSELSSQFHFSYHKQLEVLSIFQSIWAIECCKEELINNKRITEAIFNNYQYHHFDFLSSCLDFLGKLLWESSTGISSVINAMDNYKIDRGFKLKFDCLLDGLKNTSNLLIVECILKFLLELCECQTEEQKKAITKAEVIYAWIPQELEKIKLKIAQGHYKLENCTFDASIKCLINLKNSKTPQEANDIQQKLKEKAVLKKLLVLDQSKVLDEYFIRDSVDANQYKDSDIFVKDEQDFTDLVQEVDALIDVIIEDEYFKNSIDFIHKSQKKINSQDPASIIYSLMEKCLESSTYPQLLFILQKFNNIPSNSSGVDTWNKIKEEVTQLTLKHDIQKQEQEFTASAGNQKNSLAEANGNSEKLKN